MKSKKDWEILQKENPLLYWVEIMNSRCHAGMHSRRTSHEKRIVERSIVDDWHEVVLATSSHFSGTITEGNDPPDFILTTDKGGEKSIELVEFANQQLLAEIVKLRRRGCTVTSHSYPFF